MREVLLRIKRGELKLYDEILDEYLPNIYGSVLNSDRSIDANDVTIEIVLKLHKKISSFYFWNNPDKFIENNLKTISKSYQINYSSGFKEEVPDIVLRSIFLKLSSQDQRKRKLSVIIILPLIIVVLAVSLIFYNKAYSEKLYFPKSTIVSDRSAKLHKLSSTQTRIPKGIRWLDGLISIDNIQEDLILVKFVDKEDDYFYRIYKGKELIQELSIDIKYFYNNNGKDDTLIFKSSSSFCQFDYEGNVIDVIDSKKVLKISDNSRYVYLLDKNHKHQIYDLYNFEIIEEVEDNIAKLCNDGSYITDEQFRVLKDKNQLDIFENYYSNFINDYFIYLDLEGKLGIFRDEDVIFERELLYFKHIESEGIDPVNSMFYIDISEDLIFIGIEGDHYSALEAFDLQTGEIVIHLEDTISNGEMRFKPVMSEDKKKYLLSIQKWNYRHKEIKNLFLDISERPVTAIKMNDEEFLTKAEIVAKNSSYFVYTLSSTGFFSIYELK